MGPIHFDLILGSHTIIILSIINQFLKSIWEILPTISRWNTIQTVNIWSIRVLAQISLFAFATEKKYEKTYSLALHLSVF